MTYRYTAKIYQGDGEILVHSGNDMSDLMQWMHEQAETSYDEVLGEVIDNESKEVVKNFKYTPPLD